MAAQQQSAAEPEEEQDEFGDDEFGRELAQSIRANKALLAGLKYEFGQKMARAQAGQDDYPSAFDLNQLKKLEQQIQNDELFARARSLTRMRSRQSRGAE